MLKEEDIHDILARKFKLIKKALEDEVMKAFSELVIRRKLNKDDDHCTKIFLEDVKNAEESEVIAIDALVQDLKERQKLK